MNEMDTVDTVSCQFYAQKHKAANEIGRAKRRKMIDMQLQ